MSDWLENYGEKWQENATNKIETHGCKHLLLRTDKIESLEKFTQHVWIQSEGNERHQQDLQLHITHIPFGSESAFLIN